jgi:hypothetical protein
MTDWTKEEDEAFNEVERNSNLGKQIIQAQGQPYHWQTENVLSAVRMEREACARLCDEARATGLAEQIRARGNT